jgi:hypothetical protein
MFKKLKDIFQRRIRPISLTQKNRQRFDSIISDSRFNYLESIYKRLLNNDTTVTDTEILDAYFKFSDSIQTNTFAAAELEWVTISVPCYFRRNLTETLLRRALLSIVWSLGDNIDWVIVVQFIEKRILADQAEPYGGLPPDIGQKWLKEILPTEKETIQKDLNDVIKQNRIELDTN